MGVWFSAHQRCRILDSRKVLFCGFPYSVRIVVFSMAWVGGSEWGAGMGLAEGWLEPFREFRHGSESQRNPWPKNRPDQQERIE